MPSTRFKSNRTLGQIYLYFKSKPWFYLLSPVLHFRIQKVTENEENLSELMYYVFDNYVLPYTGKNSRRKYFKWTTCRCQWSVLIES